ncbi:MAG: hypothetical protein JO249_04145 [Acidobacteria bacterium]|nr:hypothetical protein [Acidobacteriota bacterium]
MPNAFDDVARRAAQRLSRDLGRNLPATVEAQLQAGKPAERFEPGTLIALAALLLNVAKFAWDIYRDRKKDAKTGPSADVLARTIRLELKVDTSVSTEQRDKIIGTVMDELLKDPPRS